MAYSAAEARQQMLEDFAVAIDEIGAALGALGAAYELLDERTGDRLEAELFRPVQLAYGRAKGAYAAFAERQRLETRAFEPATPGTVSRGAAVLLDASADALREADHLLAEIQDSMMPVEVGDAQLRAGLAETRDALGPLPGRVHEIVRVLGR
jgi:hypothetical protein